MYKLGPHIGGETDATNGYEAENIVPPVMRFAVSSRSEAREFVRGLRKTMSFFKNEGCDSVVGAASPQPEAL